MDSADFEHHQTAHAFDTWPPCTVLNLQHPSVCPWMSGQDSFGTDEGIAVEERGCFIASATQEGDSSHLMVPSIFTQEENWCNTFAGMPSWNAYFESQAWDYPAMMTAAPSISSYAPDVTMQYNTTTFAIQRPEEAPMESTVTQRELNRLAATKCRKKARKTQDRLQQQEQDLLARNRKLKKDAAALQDEILCLKAQILQHGRCGHPGIDYFIVEAARKRLL